MARTNQRYGWIPDLPDHRDHLYAAPVVHVQSLPPSADLTPKCPPVYDQGQLGSCTANAIGGAIQFDRGQQKLTDFTPSRLFIYYNERDMEGTVDTDSGAQIRDGVKSVAQLGACREDPTWPYSKPFDAKPSGAAYAEAADYKIKQYQRVARDLNQMRACLASGFPFIFGFTVYDSFESDAVAKTGVVPMPSPTESVLGGHAVLAVGYEDNTQRFIVRNSWGSHWGQKGYFTMPYSYLMQSSLASDFWTIRLV